jgi:glutamine cyclotransferase
MYEYKIADDGTLTTVTGAWEIPTKTQGLLVTATHFIYATSYGRDNRSNLYVVRRGQKDLDAATLSCFRAPSMAEGITEYNGTAYQVYESGSYLYSGDPATLNVISKIHQATVSSLTSLA